MTHLISEKAVSFIGVFAFLWANQAFALTGNLVIGCQKAYGNKKVVSLRFNNDADVLSNTSKAYGALFGLCKSAIGSTTMKAVRHSYNQNGEVADVVDYSEASLRFGFSNFSLNHAPFTGQTLTCKCAFSK